MKKYQKNIMVAIMLSLFLTACGDDDTTTQGSVDNTSTNNVSTANTSSQDDVEEVRLTDEVIAEYAEQGFVIGILSTITTRNHICLKNYTGEDTVVVIPDIVEIIGSCFKQNEVVTTIIMPDTVFEFWSFSYMTSLESITLSNSITEITDHGFIGCLSLETIDIPSSVTSIGVGVFQNCNSLSTVIIPDSVESIGEITFNGCDSLVSITIPESVTFIGFDVFRNCNALETVYVKEGSYAEEYMVENYPDVAIENY